MEHDTQGEAIKGVQSAMGGHGRPEAKRGCKNTLQQAAVVPLQVEK